MSKTFEVIRVSGVATGVGFIEPLTDGSGTFSEEVCQTLYGEIENEAAAADSEKWAIAIARALNKFYNAKTIKP